MVGLSVPETRRLVTALTAPPAARARQLRWSCWRRAHQATVRRARDRLPQMDAQPRVVAVPGTPALTDAGWARAAPLLTSVPGGRGRPPRDHRLIVAGLLWLMRRGASWREIPVAYGPWQTIASRYQCWRRDGTWDRILAVLLATEART